MYNKIAVVGRGAVGASIYEDLTSKIDGVELYHSQNIQNLLDSNINDSHLYEYIIYAGVPGVKWKANSNPNEDLNHINIAYQQILNLSSKCKKFILISSIDTMQKDSGVYGKHRKILEDKVLKALKSQCKIIQLPALVGKNVKKNIWFDLKHPYPFYVNYAMYEKLEEYAQKSLKSSLKYYSFNNKTGQLNYLHHLDFYFDNQLGLYNATHPHSSMLWLNIDNIGEILLNEDLLRYGKKTLIASYYQNKPAILKMYELYEIIYEQKFKFSLTNDQYDEFLNKVDYSSFKDQAVYVNETKFK